MIFDVVWTSILSPDRETYSLRKMQIELRKTPLEQKMPIVRADIRTVLTIQTVAPDLTTHCLLPYSAERLVKILRLDSIIENKKIKIKPGMIEFEK